LFRIKGDCYLHFPRGSNDRLNEDSAARDNDQRLFNSQNNNRGGYNVGDLDPVDGFTESTWMATFDEMYNWDFLYTAGQRKKQYESLFFAGSNISVTWTNQHGTGTQKANTQIILQFICDTVERASDAGSDGFGPTGSITGISTTTCDSTCQRNIANMRKHGLRVELYNGGNTDTPDAPSAIDGSDTDISSDYSTNNANFFGRRESEEYYALCTTRKRNKGLFHADQSLNGDTQIYTRQNPAGTQHGLECQEERDYYPWWNPSPFHDIAIITPDLSYCKSNIAPESQNVKSKYECVRPNVTTSDSAIDSWIASPTYVKYNLNQTECEANGGAWQGFSWNAQEPECVESYWTLVNYLGNIDNSLRGGQQASYDWTIPTYDELVNDHYCWNYSYVVSDSTDSSQDSSVEAACVRMMFRIRYNESTMDYDPYKTNSTMDYNENAGIISPIEENPTVDVGVLAQGLRLAINTAQTGRTFQDTSHTFLVCNRPPSAAWVNSFVLNVGVRGKRGNIVQVFPAVEYDFEPKHIYVEQGQCLHFQWEGSNTHNNGNPGGDGQTGDAGEGRDGSDRSNIVEMFELSESYPLTYDHNENFFDYVTCYHPLNPSVTVSSNDAKLVLGSAGFYKSVLYANTQLEADGADAVLDVLLNNVSGAFRQGLICCINSNTEVEFAFLSTRNNNFTNRSQKLKIIITTASTEPLSQ